MPKILTGVLSSDKGDKSFIVTVATRKTHPLYRKQYTVTASYMVHDEKNEAKVGDRITAVETRPISAQKHFKLLKIVERGGVRFEEKDATADIPEETTAEEPKK
jgi:small subunit ribosomal protein S17